VRVHVVSPGGPLSVAAPDAEIDETFAKVTGGRPTAPTLPLFAALSVHVDAPPTASDVVPTPVTLIPVTLDAARDSVAPFTVTVTFAPDEPIVIAFVLPVGETFHTPRNATDVDPVALLLASIGADADIVTTPELALVTVTEQVPSAPVTQDVSLKVALVAVALNETVAPAEAVPSVLTVAKRLAFEPASTTAGPDRETCTLVVGVGVGLALGVGDGLGLGDSVGVGAALGVGDGVGVESVGDGDAVEVGDAVGESLGVGDALGVASVGLGAGDGVGPVSDIDAEAGVQRLAIFDPLPLTGAAAANVSKVSAAPAGA